MEKVKHWSGNLASEIAIWRTETSGMIDFCQKHKSIYVFGNGKIGKALQFYLKQSGVVISGVITSDNMEEFRSKYVENVVGIILALSADYYHEILPVLMTFAVAGDVYFPSESLKRQLEQHLSPDEVEKNFWIDIFATTRCSLNCKGCSVFAPVCAPEDYKFEQFASDINRVKDLNFESLKLLKFTGGETLLNKHIFDMFGITRELFPTHSIECYTNGVLLDKLDEDKIKKLKQYDIRLIVTEYPVEKLALNRFKKTAEVFDLSVSYIYSEDEKLFCKYKLNLNKDTPKHYFFGCPRHSVYHSLFLYNGHFFKCPRAITAKHFANAFNVNYKLEENDSLDLRKVADAKEVYKFSMERKSFCGYCSPITELVPWGLSERKIEEWT